VEGADVTRPEHITLDASIAIAIPAIHHRAFAAPCVARKGSNATMNNLTEHLIEIFHACEERGMQVPFVLCAASPNGSVLCIRMHGDGTDPDVLAEHYEPEGFQMPVTCMVLDQTGEVVDITLKADQTSAH
jgi:hypothetical protein